MKVLPSGILQVSSITINFCCQKNHYQFRKLDPTVRQHVIFAVLRKQVAPHTISFADIMIISKVSRIRITLSPQSILGFFAVRLSVCCNENDEPRQLRRGVLKLQIKWDKARWCSCSWQPLHLCRLWKLIPAKSWGQRAGKQWWGSTMLETMDTISRRIVCGIVEQYQRLITLNNLYTTTMISVVYFFLIFLVFFFLSTKKVQVLICYLTRRRYSFTRSKCQNMSRSTGP